MVFKFCLFWWCVFVFAVMAVYIADHLLYRKFGAAKVVWKAEHFFKGASREEFWAQFADPSRWSPEHPVFQTADVSMIRCESKELQEEDAAPSQDEAPFANPRKKCEAVKLGALKVGLGMVLRHKADSANAGSFFCTRECTELEEPLEGSFRLVMQTVEAGLGYPFMEDSEISEVEIFPPSADGTIRCKMIGVAEVTSRIFRWWSGLQRDSQEAAIAFLQSIENEAFLAAAEKGMLEVARRHLQGRHRRMIVSSVDGHGRGAVHLAARAGHSEGHWETERLSLLKQTRSKMESSDLLPSSSLGQTLAALCFADLLQATSCSREWLQLGGELTQLPAFFAPTTPAPEMQRAVQSLPVLAVRFPQLRPEVSAVLTDWKPSHFRALDWGGHLLRRMEVQLSEGVGEHELSHILKHCPNLFYFQLSDYDLVAQNVSGNFLRDLPKDLVELRLCLLRDLQDRSLKVAVKSAPNLRSIHLEGVDELTDHGIGELGVLMLRKLSLVFTALTASPQMSEATLLRILNRSCQGLSEGLEVFQLSQHAGPPLVLSAEGVNFAKSLGAHGTSLRILTLSGVVELGDTAFQLLAASCPQLRELSLYRPGHQLSSAGLQEGLRQLSLEHVSLGCVADFAGAFQAIRVAGPGLESFEMIRYFRTAADESVHSVLQQLRSGCLPSLRSATFRGTFSSEQVAACHQSTADDLWDNLSWEQHDDQTFSIKWPIACLDECVTVDLQRCFRESDFG
ncbi:fbxl-1 [Symbiodinium sp. KB8]|nr:fbxl-1 [Symbiodinium sp. KB8]